MLELFLFDTFPISSWSLPPSLSLPLSPRKLQLYVWTHSAFAIAPHTMHYYLYFTDEKNCNCSGCSSHNFSVLSWLPFSMPFSFLNHLPKRSPHNSDEVKGGREGRWAGREQTEPAGEGWPARIMRTKSEPPTQVNESWAGTRLGSASRGWELYQGSCKPNMET